MREGIKGFFSALFLGLVRDAVKFIIAFAVGTGAGAIVCWYYNIPLNSGLVGQKLPLSSSVIFREKRSRIGQLITGCKWPQTVISL